MNQKTIVALLYSGCLSLDVTGPLEAFNYANMQATRFKPYKIILAAQTAGPVETLSGIQLIADTSLSEIGDGIDTLLVPGMRTGDNGYLQCGIVDWIVECAPSIRRVASVCSGALVLGEAGLLDGKHVTTHWMDSKILAQKIPSANVAADQIYLRDGQIYSSGGVTAGIDLALALIEEDLGHAEALKVAKRMIVPLKRAGDQSQFSDLLLAQEKASRFHGLLEWLEANLTENLSVSSMAQYCAMSNRNFSRKFTSELGVSPMIYVRNRRLERAKMLLEDTEKTIQTIARDAGFGSIDQFRRLFEKACSIGPKEYRERFGRRTETNEGP